MSEWQIKPSYKLDLACFCNLLTGQANVLTRHPQGYDAFKAALHARSDLCAFAEDMLQRGLMVGTATASMLSLIDDDDHDIDAICRIFDDAAYRPKLERYLTESGFADESDTILQHIVPLMSQMLRFFHGAGFAAYWQEKCLPQILARKQEFLQQAPRYPVVSLVNQILGLESDTVSPVTLYLCCFSAPYGIGLKHAFISDIRWDFAGTVAVAVHELIHPPFDRKRIQTMAALIGQDAFFQKAKAALPPSSGYPRPEDFLEENLVEGTHIYLCEQLGIEKNPLQYLIDHDHGSHVISVILYDALKRGYRKQTESIRETVELLIEDGTLQPGQIENRYRIIYRKAGLIEKIPFAAKP